MRIVFVVLSPTFGMYQVAADLANRLCQEHEVHLLAAQAAPADRFAPAVSIHRLTRAGNSGLEPASLDFGRLARVLRTAIALRPDLVHIVAPHVWNLPLVVWLREKGIPVVYTLHDPDPHVGTPLPRLVKWYTYWTARLADRVFIYGEVYRQRLLVAGVHPDRLVVVPLLHLFLSYQAEQRLWQALAQPGWLTYEPMILFFGRLLPYKGVDILLDAFYLWRPSGLQLVIAGNGDLNAFRNGRPLPQAVRVYDRHITDDLAVELFRTCSLVVLPYRDATQSALVAAAYVFRKPVVVTRCGAMSEYVQAGQTGFIVPPEDPLALVAALSDAFARPSQLPRMGEAGWQWYQARRREEYDRLLAAYCSVVCGYPQADRGDGPAA